MPRESQHALSYIDLLADLEKHCREIAPVMRGDGGSLRNDVDAAHRTRGRDLSAALPGHLPKFFLRLAKPEEKIAIELELGARLLRETEQKLLASIELNTTRNTEARLLHSRPWPEPVPFDRVLSRTLATALGMHTERRCSPGHHPEEDLGRCLASAIGDIVAPDLAWRLLTDVAQLHADGQEAVMRALREYITGDMIGGELLVDSHKVELPSLVLAKAWHRCLRDRLQGADVSCLLQPLSSWLDTAEPERRREELLGVIAREFGPAEHTTDRARAIEIARKRGKTAVFDQGRLQFLESAHSTEVAGFAELTRTNLGAACEDRKLSECSDPLTLAGMAFWLARACFRRTVGYEFATSEGEVSIDLRDGDKARSKVGTSATHDPAHYNRASELTCKLLEKAIALSEDEPGHVLLARRFLAGFSTNPRYWHAEYACDKAEEWVRDYKQTKGRLDSLVHQFDARLSWRNAETSKSGRKADLGPAAKGYLRSLESAGRHFDGLDAEAPIHLFAEIAVLLRNYNNKKFQGQLEAIDFILSRNFAVYMDIELEREAIESGHEQSTAIMKALDARESMRTVSEKELTGKDGFGRAGRSSR